MSEDSITEGTFERAAVGAGISVEEAKRNSLDLLRAELEKGDGTGTRQRPSASR